MKKGFVIRSLTVAASVSLMLVASRASAAPPLKIMPLGDSNTQGISYATGAYRTRLWQDFGSDPNRVEFIGSRSSGPAELGSKRHEGHSGFTIATTSSFHENITNNIAQYLSPTVNPDIILMMIGTNDINFNYRVDEAPARLDRLIAKISNLSTGLKPNAKLIVANLPPIDDAHNNFRTSPTDFSANARIMAFNAAIPGVVAAHRARGERVYFADINSALALSDIFDGLHPTAEGYNKLGDAWYAAILSVPEPNGLLLVFIAAATLGIAPSRAQRRLRGDSTGLLLGELADKARRRHVGLFHGVDELHRINAGKVQQYEPAAHRVGVRAFQ